MDDLLVFTNNSRNRIFGMTATNTCSATFYLKVIKTISADFKKSGNLYLLRDTMKFYGIL